MAIDLSKLRKGVKVRLSGSAVDQPRKPYPLGWVEVQEVDLGGAVRVVGDDRWIPTRLIVELRP